MSENVPHWSELHVPKIQEVKKTTESRDFRNTSEFQVLPDALKAQCENILISMDFAYQSDSERKNQREKFLLEVSQSIEWLDQETVQIVLEGILASWEVTIDTAKGKTEAIQKDSQAVREESIALQDKAEAIQDKAEANINKSEATSASKEEIASAKEKLEVLPELQQLMKTKEVIEKAFWKSAKDVIGGDRYDQEIAKNEKKLQEEWSEKNWNKKIEELPTDKQKEVQELIRTKAEARTLVSFKEEFAAKAPPASREELLSQLSALESITGPVRSAPPPFPSAVVKDAATPASDYRMVLSTGLSSRRDVYQDGSTFRAVPDSKGLFPSFMPGKGLYMNNEQGLQIKISLAPEDQMQVDSLSSMESNDREKLQSLKSMDEKEEKSRQNALFDSWSVVAKEWSYAPKDIQQALKNFGIDLDNPSQSRGMIDRSNIERAKNDPVIQSAFLVRNIQESNFSPIDFFYKLETLSKTVEAKNSDEKQKRQANIKELEAKLDPINNDSYKIKTNEIYQKAYESSRENLVFLTDKLGLDSVGQEFVNALGDALKAKGVKFELSKPLTTESKKELVNALNSLLNTDPAMYQEENGDIKSNPEDPIGKRKALSRALENQKIIKQPGNVLDQSRMREMLGVKL